MSGICEDKVKGSVKVMVCDNLGQGHPHRSHGDHPIQVNATGRPNSAEAHMPAATSDKLCARTALRSTDLTSSKTKCT